MKFGGQQQPIQALEHPKFKDMIDVVSRATQGVKIPGRKATRAEIMWIFKNHLTQLKKKLNVCISHSATCTQLDSRGMYFRVIP